MIGETVQYIEAPSGPLLGIVTTAADARGRVVLCPGGWHSGNANANRMLVRMSRRLGALGRTTVRFDWHGTGESPGHIRGFNLNEPSPGQPIAAATQLAAADGLPTSLLGICFGARSALAAAPDIDHLQSVILVSFPLPTARIKDQRAASVGTLAALRQGLRPETLKGWFQPATRRVYLKFISLKWRSLRRRLNRQNASQTAETERRTERQAIHLDDLVAQLGALVERGVKVLLMFGSEDALYDQFLAASSGPLGGLITASDGQIEVMALEGDLVGFAGLDVQSTFLDTVIPWLTEPGHSDHTG